MDETRDKMRFIINFGKALHDNGTPAHRTEAALVNMANHFGLRAQFFSMPTALFASFKFYPDKERTYIERVVPGSVNLHKLSLLDRIGDQVLSNNLDILHAKRAIDRVMSMRSLYPRWLTSLCYGVTALGVCSLIGGNWLDLSFSFIFGFMVGLLSEFRSLYRMGGDIFDGFASFVIAALANLALFITPSIHPSLIVMSGLIVLLPGLGLTVALNELATNNLTSGTARLMGALMGLLLISFGVFVGTKLIGNFPIPEVAINPIYDIPSFMSWLILPLTGVAFTILFKAHPKDMYWIILAGFLAALSSRFGSLALGRELGVFLGGFLVGAASNLFARFMKRPASIFMLPGIILLVPGSVGYRSLTLFFEKNTLQGVDAGFAMIATATAIVAGLFLGNVAINPRRSI